ncbi:MAG TPA: ferredoxin [Nitrospiraceae bacterium]|jgi:NAD-dependent dihydropyrimidine dehydrogenase PreA subunit|nr:ferredoxin [Nitrospiraceae bacterium]
MKYLSNTATLELFPERCVGCGRCLEVCPHEVFALEDGKAVILDKDRCIECGACVNNCAFGALIVDKGVGCAAALINSMITGGEPSCGCDDKKKAGDCC